MEIQDEGDAKLIESQLPIIVALTKGGKSAKVVRDVASIPEGCGSGVVTPGVVVHTLVRVRVPLLTFIHALISSYLNRAWWTLMWRLPSVRRS